LLLVSL